MRPARRAWGALFVSISLVLVAGGYWYYLAETEEIRQEKSQALSAIAELKAGQIAQWRKERLGDASRSAQSPFARRALEQWLRAPDTPGLREDWSARLKGEQQTGEYADALLVAPDGQILLAATADSGPLTPISQRALAAALASGAPVLSDFYRGARGAIDIDVTAPMLDSSGRVLAALILRSDAHAYLYPLVQSWPTPSRSAETLLVERDGDDIVFVNELRHRQATALSFRVPLSRTNLPGVQAVLGRTGRIEGTDYRGIAVLAEGRRIPGSPWSMVAKVDSSEILTEARSRAELIALIVSGLILFTGAMIALVYRQRQARLYREMLQAERATRAARMALERSQAELKAVLDNLPVGIAVNTVDSGVAFSYMNDNFPAFYRTTRDKLSGPDAFWSAAYEEPGFRDEIRARVLEGCASGDPQRMYWADIPITRKGGETTFVTARNIPLPDQGLWVSTVWDVTERKRAEDALRASEERHRKLFEEATEGIALADAGTGEILGCNQAFLQLSGYELSELIGRPQAMLHPTEEGGAPVSRTFVDHRSDKAGEVLPATLVTRSGAHKQVEVKANVVEIGGRPVVQAFFRDITEEVRYEHERDTTLALMRLLNDPNSTHELIRNLTGLIRDWTGCEAVGVRLRNGDDFPYYETRGFPAEFVAVENNLCLRDAHGQALRDGLGHPALECMCGNVLRGRFNPALPFFTPKGSFWSNCTTELLATTTEADRQAHTRNRCNGEGYESVALFPLRCGDEVLGLLQVNDRVRGRFTPEKIGFLEGIADQIALAVAQRQAQASLRESEQFNREVIAGVHEGLVVYDRDFRYLAWNRFMEDLTGMPASDVLGRCALDLFAHLRANDIEALLRRALAGEAVRSPEVYFDVAQTGRSGWYSAVYSPHCDSHGGIIGVIGIIRDVTERKRADAEREALEAQLLQAQKMESVGRLAGGVAHDFNNMLSVIVGHSELALRHVQPADALYQDIQEILSAAQRSADLTRQLLAFARKQTIQPKVLDLNDTVARLLKMLGRLIGEDIDLVWKPAGSLASVLMDPAQLAQILANLAVNARDAIQGVGRITIETRNGDPAEDGHLRAMPGRFVVLQVHDDGCGMDAGTLAHLFEPFFTTKPQGQGTGLGLATVYGIVRQNHGFIDVSSEPGQGATFTVFLPAHESGPATGAGPAPSAVPRGTETVLLVEDEKVLLELGRRLLETLGYTVLATESPTQALQLVGEFAGEIHLLLTDVVMPEVSGRELHQRLSVSRPGLKCLFMSGYTADILAPQGVLEQGIHFLQKPFSLETLAIRLREALAAR